MSSLPIDIVAEARRGLRLRLGQGARPRRPRCRRRRDRAEVAAALSGRAADPEHPLYDFVASLEMESTRWARRRGPLPGARDRALPRRLRCPRAGSGRRDRSCCGQSPQQRHAERGVHRRGRRVPDRAGPALGRRHNDRRNRSSDRADRITRAGHPDSGLSGLPDGNCRQSHLAAAGPSSPRFPGVQVGLADHTGFDGSGRRVAARSGASAWSQLHREAHHGRSRT